MINSNDNNLKWDILPDDLWKEIVSEFLSKQVTHIGFKTIKNQSDDPKQSIALDSWNLIYVKNYLLKINWNNQLGETLQLIQDISVFEYDQRIGNELAQVKFSYWNKTSAQYPIEEIFFFKKEQLLLIADTLESILTFPELDNKQLQSLKAIDKRINQNLLIINGYTVKIINSYDLD